MAPPEPIERHQRGECWRLSWRPNGTYYALRWVPAAGAWLRRSTGCTVRRAAAEVAAKWLQEGERLAAGLRSGVDQAVARPLRDHVAAFIAARKNAPEALTGQHVDQTHRLLVRVMQATGWRWLPDVTEDGLHAAVARLSAASSRKGGWSAATRNHCMTAWCAFCRWAVRDGRLAASPLANVRMARVDGFRSFERRALTRDEADRLLRATEVGPEVAGMEGPDRAWLYRLALVTGFRRGELASLTPASFRLDVATPVVLLHARAAKARKEAQQPLPPWVVAPLRLWLAGKPRHARLWAAMPASMSAVVRADARRGGVPLGDEHGARLDFHAFRHTFGTWLAQAGVTPQAAQRLMRHANVQLTMRVYTHLAVDELAASAAKISIERCGIVAVSPPTTEGHGEPGLEGGRSQDRGDPAQDAGNGDGEGYTTETHGGPPMAEGCGADGAASQPVVQRFYTDLHSVAAPRVADAAPAGVASALQDAGGRDGTHARDRAEAGQEPDLALAVARIQELGAMAPRRNGGQA